MSTVLPYDGMPGENLEIALEEITQKIGVAGLRHILVGTNDPYDDVLPVADSPGPRPIRGKVPNDHQSVRSLFQDDASSQTSSERPAEGEELEQTVQLDQDEIQARLDAEFGECPADASKSAKKRRSKKIERRRVEIEQDIVMNGGADKMRERRRGECHSLN